MALAILALQTITHNKYIGYLLALGLFIVNALLQGLGINIYGMARARTPKSKKPDKSGFRLPASGFR